MKLDYLHGTTYTIQQREDMYHFNSDTELLGKFLDVHHKDSVLDIGCNNGALLCYANLYKPKHLVGIDLFEEVIQLAQDNLKKNQIDADLYVTSLQQFQHACFDVIICNPPYFDTKVQHLTNENPYIKAARHEKYLTVDDLCKHVSRLLKENGSFQMVYRPDRMTQLFHIASIYHLYPKRLKIVYASIQKQAKSILVEFVKNPNIKLTIESPAFLNDRSSYWKGDKQ